MYIVHVHVVSQNHSHSVMKNVLNSDINTVADDEDDKSSEVILLDSSDEGKNKKKESKICIIAKISHYTWGRALEFRVSSNNVSFAFLLMSDKWI